MGVLGRRVWPFRAGGTREDTFVVANLVKNTAALGQSLDHAAFSEVGVFSWCHTTPLPRQRQLYGICSLDRFVPPSCSQESHYCCTDYCCALEAQILRYLRSRGNSMLSALLPGAHSFIIFVVTPKAICIHTYPCAWFVHPLYNLSSSIVTYEVLCIDYAFLALIRVGRMFSP